MARELEIIITADGRQAVQEFRNVDRAQAQTEQGTKKLAQAQAGLVDAYGRAVKPTQDYAREQNTVNQKKKESISITEQLSGAMLKFISGAVLLAAIDRTIKYASSLEKMANALGTGVKGIQQLENIAAISNTTVDAMSNAIFQMQIRIAGNDKSAVAAFKQLGISIRDWAQLRPEEQFMAVARASRSIGDEATRNRLFVDIFGKSAREVMGALTGDVDKLKDGVHLMSDQTVKDLTIVEGSWNRLLLAAKRYFGEVMAMAVPKGASPWLQAAGARFADASYIGMGVGDGNLPGLPAAPGGLPFGAGPRADMTSAAMPLGGQTLEQQQKANAAAIARQQMFAGIQSQDTAVDLPNSPSAWQGWMNTQQRGFQEGPLGSFNAANFGSAVGENFLGSRAIGTGMGYGPAQINTQPPGAQGFFQRSGITGDAITNMGMMAATGGGNVGQAAGGMLAGGAVKSLMTNSAGKMLGGTLGSFLPGIGTILGTLAGSALGKLIGPSEESSKVNQPREAFFAKQGGLDTVNAQMMQATGSIAPVQDLFGAKTEKDMTAAMSAITSALDGYVKKLGEAETALAGVTAQSIHVTEITPEMQAALDSALNATTVDDYNTAMGTLGGLMGDQVSKQKELDETLKKYGLSWTETGDRAKMAKLAEIAGGLTKEFDILKGAGVDVNHIMGKMGPHVNQFVKDAKTAGTEVPESFKRIIQTAIDSGQVFEDNGAKVTDITTLGLTFGSTMETVQREMVDAMKELSRVLKEDLGGAFANVRSTADAEFKRIPRNLDIKVNYDSEGYDVGERSHSGSVIRPWGLERFHSGGLLHDERVIIGQTGEGILNRRAVANIGPGAVHALNRGQMPMGGAVDHELRAEVKGLRADMARDRRQLPDLLERATLVPRPR